MYIKYKLAVFCILIISQSYTCGQVKYADFKEYPFNYNDINHIYNNNDINYLTTFEIWNLVFNKIFFTDYYNLIKDKKVKRLKYQYNYDRKLPLDPLIIKRLIELGRYGFELTVNFDTLGNIISIKKKSLEHFESYDTLQNYEIKFLYSYNEDNMITSINWIINDKPKRMADIFYYPKNILVKENNIIKYSIDTSKNLSINIYNKFPKDIYMSIISKKNNIIDYYYQNDSHTLYFDHRTYYNNRTIKLVIPDTSVIYNPLYNDRDVFYSENFNREYRTYCISASFVDTKSLYNSYDQYDISNLLKRMDETPCMTVSKDDNGMPISIKIRDNIFVNLKWEYYK